MGKRGRAAARQRHKTALPSSPTARLVEALRPFAGVKLPEDDGGADAGPAVWLCVGKPEAQGTGPHLTVADFRRARAALRGVGR